MISIALLAMLSVTVIGLFSKMMASGSKQADQGVARRLAEKILSRAAREGPPNWGATGASYQDSVMLTSLRSERSTEYFYQVQVDHIQSGSLGELQRVQVQVNWWPTGTDADNMRRDRGRLSVTVDQLVYTGK